MEKERFKKLAKLVKVTSDGRRLESCLPYVDALGKGWREKVKRELGGYNKEAWYKQEFGSPRYWHEYYKVKPREDFLKEIERKAMWRIWFTTQMFWRLVIILAIILLLLSVFIHWVIPIIGVVIWILFESYDSATHAYRGYSN